MFKRPDKEILLTDAFWCKGCLVCFEREGEAPIEKTVKDIKSITLLHEITDTGLGHTADVFITLPTEERGLFGGRLSENRYVGTISSGNPVHTFIKESLAGAKVPVLEL